MFKLEIQTENAAFGDTAEDAAAEVARLLRSVATRLERLEVEGAGAVHDFNGNRVGAYALTLSES